MSAIDCAPCIERLLQHEGSHYTDGVHPYDPGGPTRWGITIKDARMYWRQTATADDVRVMPQSVAVGIYRSKYWVAVRGDDLPAGVDDCVFDYAVNSGWGRAGKVLRRVVGMPATGWEVTDEVLAAVNRRKSKDVIEAICTERLAFMQTLAIWPTYKNGWTTRVREVQAYSYALAANPSPTVAPVASVNTLVTAKAAIPAPTAARTAVVGGGAASGAAGAGNYFEWFAAHPYETGAILAAGALVIGGIVYLINRNHQAKQEAPMPNTWVVAPKGL